MSRNAALLALRHGRARPGHPRLSCRSAAKTWMPGTRPGMTNSVVRSAATPRVSGRCYASPGEPRGPECLELPRLRELDLNAQLDLRQHGIEAGIAGG